MYLRTDRQSHLWRSLRAFKTMVKYGNIKSYMTMDKEHPMFKGTGYFLKLCLYLVA